MRAALRRGVAVSGDVVDFLLPFFHTRHVVGQRHVLLGSVGMGRRKAQQFGDRFLVTMVFRRPFFQHQTKLFPEGQILLSIVFRQLIQHLQHALGQSVTQVAGDVAVLQNFTGDVQRQIVGIDKTAYETQVVRHKLLGVVHDKDALYVQLQAVFMVTVPHIPRRLRRDIQQAGVLLLAFHAVVAPGQRVGKIVGDMLVERFVFVVVQLGFITRPQRLRFVDFLPGNHGFAVFLFGFFNFYRQRDMVGVFADDRTYAPVVEELVLAFAQVQGNFSTAIVFGDVGHGVFARAFGFPEHAVLCAITRRAGAHGDFIRHDKRGIETDAELTDQLAVFGLVRTHGFEECFGAGFCDRPEMIDNLVAIHTNTVVGNGQRTLIFIEGDAYA